jgi:hypothetical protein
MAPAVIPMTIYRWKSVDSDKASCGMTFSGPGGKYNSPVKSFSIPALDKSKVS